ncbi:MAG: MerR family transcriptional regulator [Paludibacteraceae bacterium]|nr:MerR family transcriptional regulator [Paludibacteraceae bacterium]MBP6284641.1 MerR family transcriptional regulator [Paludibacteraceae bacterium]
MSNQDNTTTDATPHKLYYSIKEVAEILQVNVSAVRFWEQQFDTIKLRKNDKGTSFYTQENIDELLLIKHLKEEKGLTLDGIKKRLKDNKIGARKNFEIIDSLQNIKKQLLNIKNELDNLKE